MEAPHLQQKVQPKYGERGVQAVGVVWRQSEQWAREYVRRFGLTYPIVMDPEGKLLERLGNWIPLTVLIDREGRYCWAISGAFPRLVEDALEAILAGREPPVSQIPKPQPQDLQVAAVRTTREGDLFVTFTLTRQDYYPIDAHAERGSGQVEHIRAGMFWSGEGGAQTWWLTPVEPGFRVKGRGDRMRLAFKPRYSDGPAWGTHIAPLPEVARDIELPAPQYATAADLIAAELGGLPSGTEATKPSHPMYASRIRSLAASERARYWWRKGDRLKMARAREELLAEPYFQEERADRISGEHVETGDAFAAAGDKVRARRHYVSALETARNEEEKRQAEQRLHAIDTHSREPWQKAARQRTAPPEE